MPAPKKQAEEPAPLAFNLGEITDVLGEIAERIEDLTAAVRDGTRAMERLAEEIRN